MVRHSNTHTHTHISSRPATSHPELSLTSCSLIEHLFEGVRLGVNATAAPTPHAEALRELSKTDPLCFFNVAHFPLSLCRETVALLQAHLEAAAASIRESLLDVFDSARAYQSRLLSHTSLT